MEELIWVGRSLRLLQVKLHIAGGEKKVLLLFDFACHPCTGTMLIFSVYLSVCLMSQPEGWTTLRAKNKYINLTYFRASSAVEPVLLKRRREIGAQGQNPAHVQIF